MAQQTSVDWLVSELNHCLESNGKIEVVPELLVKLQEQANQIHKEQIINADFAGVERTIMNFNKYIPTPDVLNILKNIKEGTDTHENGEQYYNETFNQ